MTLRLATLGRSRQVNPCGGCTACCTEIGVKELGKPPRCRCEHQTESGCGVYGTHPQECRGFVCAWAMGALGSDDKYRPDRCGLLFTLNNTDPPSIAVHILKREADNDRVQYLLQRVRQKYPGYPLTLIYPFGVQVGASYDCREPYPADMSNRRNSFVAPVTDTNTRICEGPERILPRT
jgi:hypothetical protein